jgi:hypothetical protein
MKECITHYPACNCREAQFQKMEIALKVIQTWASVSLRISEPPADFECTLEDIRDKCIDTLSK